MPDPDDTNDRDDRTMIHIQMSKPELVTLIEDTLDRKLDEKLEEKLDRMLDAKLDTMLDAKLDTMLDAKLDPKFAAFEQRLDQKFDAKFDVFERRFEAIDRKFEAIDRSFILVMNEFQASEARIMERVRAEIVPAVTAAVTAAVSATLGAEMARHIKASEESWASRLRVVDDQYKDLPGRVTRIEAKVFKPKATKRARRSS